MVPESPPEAALEDGTITDPPAPTSPNAPVTLFLLALACAGIWAYRNSLDGGGIFDDDVTVGLAVEMYEKPSLEILRPRPRSLAFLSIALNHRFGGANVHSYHEVNRAIHILAALALFGVTRLALRLPSLGPRFNGARADWIAFCIALIWLVHPLQTQAVSYMVQRIEASMGLFYLLCFYCFLRGAIARRGWPWYLLSALLFYFGIGTKEVIGTAPLLMLMFDRIFLASSGRDLFRRRAWFYGAMLGPMLLFAAYMAPYFNKGWEHEMGLGHPWITPWMYARTETAVVLHYLRLAFWPDRLCLDYCWPVMSVRQLIGPLAIMSALLAATAWALRFRPRIGFLAAGFFLILAPTSSVIPINDLAMEHRMYLPLAFVVTLTVLAAFAACERLAARAHRPGDAAPAMLAALVVMAAVPLTLRTVARNEDYRDSLIMWRSCVAACPTSHRAHFNLGSALWRAGRQDEALTWFRRSFDLECLYSGASAIELLRNYESLKWVMKTTGHPDGIFRVLDEGLKAHPELVHYHWFLGDELLRAGDYSRAVRELAEAVRIDPGLDTARVMLATALFVQGRPRDALAQLRQVVGSAPKDTATANYLAWVLATHPDPTVRDGQEAVRLAEDVCIARKSTGPKAWGTLAAAYAEAGRFDDAVAACRRSIALIRGEEGGDPEPLSRQMHGYARGRPYRIRVEDLVVRRPQEKGAVDGPRRTASRPAPTPGDAPRASPPPTGLQL